MGFNVTTQSGVQVYKMIITLLPLIPILVLLVQNALYVNNLLTQQSSISYTESQVTTLTYIDNKFNKLSVFYSRVNIQKYSICSCHCGDEYDRVAIFRGLVHGLCPPIATVICVRWRNTWPAASNHIDNKND